MADLIEIKETWKVVDRWWTPEPSVKHYVGIEIDGVPYVFCFDQNTETWTIRMEK